MVDSQSAHLAKSKFLKVKIWQKVCVSKRSNHQLYQYQIEHNLITLSQTHKIEEKYLQINNTLFVGRSDNFDCDNQKEPSYLWFDKERNKGGTMWPGRNWKGYKTGHAGILWPIFSGIGVPLGKPWVNGKPKSFPLLTGQAYLNSVTFYNFKVLRGRS